MWPKNVTDVPLAVIVKHPQKMHVWGMMSHRALFHLHIVAPNTTINEEYYWEKMSGKEGLDATNRTDEIGTALQRKLAANQDHTIFMRDSAPPHTAGKIQKSCMDHFSVFYEKGMEPSNTPN